MPSSDTKTINQTKIFTYKFEIQTIKKYIYYNTLRKRVTEKKTIFKKYFIKN